MSHKAQQLLFPTNKGTVLTSGYSNHLSKGVLGIVDKNGVNTKDGIPLVSTFDEDGKYELRLGVASKVSRSRSDKSWSSLTFKTKDILDIQVSAPSLKQQVDEVWLGYNGHDVDSAIVLERNESAVINLILKGEGLAMIGYPKGVADLKFHITAPDNDNFTMQEVIEKAVAQIKTTTLNGGIPLTEFVEVKVINSEATALTGTTYNIYELIVPLQGGSNTTGLVQAQYPNLNIKFDSYLAGKSKFLVYAETAPADFVVNDVTIVTNCDEYESSDLVPTNYAWADTGNTCTVTERTYTIVLPDDDCGNPRTAELTEAYPDLTITAGESSFCQTEYTALVSSDFLCEGCSEEVQDLFGDEAPEPYDGVAWEVDASAYSDTALMGIAFKGKQTIVGGGEEYRDSLPYIYNYVQLSVNGGSPFQQYMNFYNAEDERLQADKYFKTTWISRGHNPEGLGKCFLEDEEKTRIYYSLTPRLENNLFGNTMLGNESLIDPFAQYVMYSIHIRRKTISQSFTEELNEHVQYNIIAEVGYHKDVEALVNALATGAGLPTVEAYEEA